MACRAFSRTLTTNYLNSSSAITMPNHFKSLYAAILEDDRAKVIELLKTDPGLARQEAADQSKLASRIAHWIYAGDTPLHVAAAGYRVEIARMLLTAGANVGSAKSRRWSQPLHYASDGYLESPTWNAGRQVAMIRLLVEAGANINGQDKNGATPLHRAVRTRCAAAVKFILDAGGDPTIRNKPGSTPFHLAVQNTAILHTAPNSIGARDNVLDGLQIICQPKRSLPADPVWLPKNSCDARFRVADVGCRDSRIKKSECAV